MRGGRHKSGLVANDRFCTKRGSHAYMTAGATRLPIGIWGQ